MRYADLIGFNPIESIIQLTDANDREKECSLVGSYVMSDDMADKLKNNVLSQLRLDEVVDNKGVLLVGNYGTGKSHLMSLISAVARDADYLKRVQNAQFASDAACIAGQFEVLRIEIGAVQMSLRNIILSKVRQDFALRGLDFAYPDDTEIVSNKETLTAMMELFAGRYQDRGYLIVVDEFLDYLGGRKEQEVKLDLGFMRELGEMVKNSRLRVIFGVQEKLFENPSFSFVSQTLNRVKDRFEQITIRKEDTAYVVSERILKKSPEQKALIRGHLQKFCSLYSNMSERMEEYVSLFPIHPSYIDVFNKIYIIENRHILKNISEIIRRILHCDLSDETPGIISFDSYWAFIKENLALKTDANIKEVVEKSGMLEDIITRAFPKRLYKPLALQIIHALSVHRLTTGDISIRAGLTPENLRDDLCLYLPGMPDQSSDTLQSIIQVTLKDIMTTVSGQFIESNAENGQYYLDLKKDIDYDEKIAQRAAVIDEDRLNKYFYDIIYYCLEWDAKEHVTNFKIYEHTLNWISHNIFRKGYLFLGTPENRPTAQPAEDYYIYFLPPYGGAAYTDAHKSDEVFFHFRPNEEFKKTLCLYAASLMMKELAEEKNKGAYHAKAEGFKKSLVRFLSENKNTCFEVSCQGVKKPLPEVLKGHCKASNPFKETIDLAASLCLDSCFSEKYPLYPRFKTQITLKNLSETLRAGFDRYAGRKNQQANSLLESFDLLDGEKISVSGSRYAQHFISALSRLPAGAVINFSDICEETFDGYADKQFKLSHTMLPIILLALVYSGNAVMAWKGGVLTASELDGIPKISLPDICEFKYISRPKDIQLAELIRLFEVLELPAGLIRNPAQREAGLERLLTRAGELAGMAANASNRLNGAFELWGEPLMAEHIAAGYRESCARVTDVFGNFAGRFNTVAKLPNFTYTKEEIDRLALDIRAVRVVLEYDRFQSECAPEITYMMNLERMKPGTPLLDDIQHAKTRFRQIRDGIAAEMNGDACAADIKALLSSIKARYIDLYYAEHSKKRLGVAEGQRKSQIVSSAKLANLRRLKLLSIFSPSKVDAIESELDSLKICYELTPEMLKTTPFCTKCGFLMDGSDIPFQGRLDSIEARMDRLLSEWNATLHHALSDPLLEEQLTYLSEPQRSVIAAYQAAGALPKKIDASFVDAVNALLAGFEPVSIPAAELIDRLDAFGPCDVDTFKRRLDEIITAYTDGKCADRLRIVVKR